MKELKKETDILETFTSLIDFERKPKYYIGEVFKQNKKIKRFSMKVMSVSKGSNVEMRNKIYLKIVRPIKVTRIILNYYWRRTFDKIQFKVFSKS